MIRELNIKMGEVTGTLESDMSGPLIFPLQYPRKCISSCDVADTVHKRAPIQQCSKDNVSGALKLTFLIIWSS